MEISIFKFKELSGIDNEGAYSLRRRTGDSCIESNAHTYKFTMLYGKEEIAESQEPLCSNYYSLLFHKYNSVWYIYVVILHAKLTLEPLFLPIIEPSSLVV